MATIPPRPKLRLGLRSSGRSMTAAEVDALPERCFDRNYRYEIIRGVLIVSPAAGNGEVDLDEYLGYLLIGHQETHPQSQVIDVTLSELALPGGENRRRCDRAIWLGLGHIPNLGTDLPAIVIEFVSRSRRDFLRDYIEKRDEYRRAGALEYWIIDRFRRIMTVYRFARGTGTVETVVTVAEDDSYRSYLLPGSVLSLARLLSRADRWKRPPRARRPKPPKPQAPEGDPR